MPLRLLSRHTFGRTVSLRRLRWHHDHPYTIVMRDFIISRKQFHSLKGQTQRLLQAKRHAFHDNLLLKYVRLIATIKKKSIQIILFL